MIGIIGIKTSLLFDLFLNLLILPFVNLTFSLFCNCQMISAFIFVYGFIKVVCFDLVLLFTIKVIIVLSFYVFIVIFGNLLFISSIIWYNCNCFLVIYFLFVQFFFVKPKCC